MNSTPIPRYHISAPTTDAALLRVSGDDVACDERRDQREDERRHEEEHHEGDDQPCLPDVAPEPEQRLVWAPVLDDEDGDEREWDEDRGAEAEVGALLREELREL